MDAQAAAGLASELKAKHGSQITFSKEALGFFLQHDCRCVYCHRPLLTSYEVQEYGTAFDHLLPKCLYKPLENEPTNQVLACRRCNMRKGDWDPNKQGGAAIRDLEDKTPITEGQRHEFIERAKKELGVRSSLDNTNFSRSRQLILEAAPWIEF